MARKLAALIFCIFLFPFLACSRNGFEGHVAFVGGEGIGDASGLTVIASCPAHKKGMLPIGNKTVKTDASGSFRISNINPEAIYQIYVDDERYISSIEIRSPRERATTPSNPSLVRILICPKPPLWKKGIWVYESLSNPGQKPIYLETENSDASVLPAIVNSETKFIPNNQYLKANFISANAGNDGAILLIGPSAPNFLMYKLHQFEARPDCNLEGGWYLGVAEISSNCSLKPDPDGEISSFYGGKNYGGFSRTDQFCMVFPTGGFSPGLYYFDPGYVLAINYDEEPVSGEEQAAIPEAKSDRSSRPPEYVIRSRTDLTPPPALSQAEAVGKMAVPEGVAIRPVDSTTSISVKSTAGTNSDKAADEPMPTADQFVPFEEAPVQVTAITPNYPEQARRANIQGTVWVKALVDKEGKVRDVLIIKESGANAGFGESAKEAAMQTRWKPAIADGKPVAVWVTYKVDFKLK